MRSIPRSILLLPFTVLSLWSIGSLGLEPRRFTVRDSIEMSTFSRDLRTRKGEVKFSPDGRYLFVITRRGLLPSNEIESVLWLFDVNSIKASIREVVDGLRPRPLVRMAAPSAHDQVTDDPISDANWAADGQSISFMGRNRLSGRHLFIVNVRDSRLRQLSLDGQDVTSFAAAGSKVVYTEAKPVSESDLYQAAGPTLPDIQIGTGLSLTSLVFPNWEKALFEERPERLWKVDKGMPSLVVERATGLPVSLTSNWFGSLRSLSPSGNYVVVKDYAERVPPDWELYEVAYDHFPRIVADPPNRKPVISAARPQQYKLIDLKTGKMLPLVNAPLGQSAGYDDEIKVAWSRDEHFVAVTNTLLPLQSDGVSRSAPKRPCVAVVELITGKVECVKESAPVDLNQGLEHQSLLTDIEWHDRDRQLVLHYSRYRGEDDALPAVFERQDGIWRQVTNAIARRSAATTFTNSDLQVSIRESVNERPLLIARDVLSGTSRTIWDPNPQFAEINLGEATVYHWRDAAGNEWTGGLVMPPDYIPGRRYPLVIQTHGFNSNEFLTDGFVSTANAARPLAGRGIIVLQVGEPARHFGTPVEADLDGQAGYVSAIDGLVAEGLVDAEKIGITGFSFTGWYVLNSLIHGRRRFAAATLAEFSTASFWQYLAYADYISPQGSKELADQIGSEPFGDGLKKWIDASPGFNTDKINVPILFESNYPASLIIYWEIYASLRLQGKPVELLYMRNGDHVLTMPLEQLASQEMTVDWYDFWLNGHEVKDPAKTEQYVRWHQLR